MNINLVQLWAEMGLPVKCVVVILTLQAMASLAVAIDRGGLLFRANRGGRVFAKEFRKALDGGPEKALELTSRTSGSHLAAVLHTGLDNYLNRREAGDSPERAIELAKRAMDRRFEAASDDIQRGMGVLASTGSTAPFVGLLGTVLGIINAFQMIAASGSGGIGTIGASIGEALIVTGYGLCVAIPTVLAHNYLAGRLGRYEMAIQHGTGELTDHLDALDVKAPQTPSPKRVTSPVVPVDARLEGAMA